MTAAGTCFLLLLLVFGMFAHFDVRGADGHLVWPGRFHHFLYGTNPNPPPVLV
jgi:hypothetical protein